MSRLNKQEGFTLIELLLAMTLFTTVMLVATVGFIGINRTYTRGMVKKQLSESVQVITDDLTRAVQTQSKQVPGEQSINGWSMRSFASSCYFWKNNEGDSGLYKSPGACDSTSEFSDKKVGLLDERYRVEELKIETVNSNLFRISGTFTTTDLDALVIDPPADFHKRCKGTTENVNVATCAVENFSFIVANNGANI